MKLTMPTHDLSELYQPTDLRRAHSIRKLGGCRVCGAMGFDLPLVQARRTASGQLRDKEYAHGRCYITEKGGDERGLEWLLRLPTPELNKIVVGDIGITVMRALGDRIDERMAVAKSLTPQQKAVLRWHAWDGAYDLFPPLRVDPRKDKAAKAVAASRESGGRDYGRRLATLERVERALYKKGLLGGIGRSQWAITNEGWQALMGLDDIERPA